MSVKLDKTSGGSNSISTNTVVVSREAVHYGRTSTPQTKWKVTAGGASATMTVTEAAYGLYKNVSSSQSVANSSTSFSINGTTNAHSIKATISENNISASLGSLTANGANQTVSSGRATISGDPGANGTFSFTWSFSCGANKTISARTVKITFTFYTSSSDTTGQSVTVTVTQAAGSAYVYWSTTSGQETTAGSATMTQAGTAINTYIMSNTSWTITKV